MDCPSFFESDVNMPKPKFLKTYYCAQPNLKNQQSVDPAVYDIVFCYCVEKAVLLDD